MASFLAENKEEFELTESNRVRSLITNHELPLSVEEIKKYCNSKKYKMAKEWHEFNVEKYIYIVPHKTNKNKMWCQLSHKSLNKIPSQVLKHVEGKKFLRLKKERDSLKNAEPQAGSMTADGDDVDMEYMQQLAESSGDDEEGQGGDDDDVIEEDDASDDEENSSDISESKIDSMNVPGDKKRKVADRSGKSKEKKKKTLHK